MKEKVQQIQSSLGEADKYTSLIGELSTAMDANKYGLQPEERKNVIELCAIELKSIPLREKYDSCRREDIITGNVEQSLSNLNENEKLVINCGMRHAQKVAYWKLGAYKVLGERLQATHRPQDLYHLSVFSMKGYKKPNYYSKDRTYHDILTSHLPPNLSRDIARRAKENISFIDFSNSSYTNKIRIVYGSRNDIDSVIPGEHFDGLLIYPTQTVLESSLYYEDQ